MVNSIWAKLLCFNSMLRHFADHMVVILEIVTMSMMSWRTKEIRHETAAFQAGETTKSFALSM